MNKEQYKFFVDLLHGGINPYEDFPNTGAEIFTGLGSYIPHMVEPFLDSNPNMTLAAEIGVWYGGSAIALAKAMKARNINGLIIAVDTFLGGHHMRVHHFDQLKVRYGMPTFYRIFMSSVMAAGVQDYILPFPSSSKDAARMFELHKIVFDLIYVDGSHYQEDCYDDLKSYYPLVRPGGWWYGDDYTSEWGVKKAVDQFAAENNLNKSEGSFKWILKK